MAGQGATLGNTVLLARSFSTAGQRGAVAWRVAEGAGAPAPTGGGLQTDEYTALLNTRNRSCLQLYHGSTGAVMFRSGPPDSRGGGEENQSSRVDDKTHWEELCAGHRRVCWLGWDGSIKEGLDGKQDFSAWLCPQVAN